MINKYLIVIFLILMTILLLKYFAREHFEEEEKLPERPFCNLFDDKGRHLMLCLLVVHFGLMNIIKNTKK